MKNGAGRGIARSLFLSSIFLVLFGHISSASELPHVYALVNARVVTAPGKVLEKATVVVRGGLVEASGCPAPSPCLATRR